jgi:hypothetical protein
LVESIALVAEAAAAALVDEDVENTRFSTETAAEAVRLAGTEEPKRAVVPQANPLGWVECEYVKTGKKVR